MITDITKAYKDYAIYLPSLQESYADFCFNEKLLDKDGNNKRAPHFLEIGMLKNCL